MERYYHQQGPQKIAQLVNGGTLIPGQEEHLEVHRGLYLGSLGAALA